MIFSFKVGDFCWVCLLLGHPWLWKSQCCLPGLCQVRVREAETEQREQFGVFMTRSDLKMESFRLWESSLEVAKLLPRENILKTLLTGFPAIQSSIRHFVEH